LYLLIIVKAITYFLRRMKNVWTNFIGDEEKALIDAGSVHLLQSRCPGLSLEDRAIIQKHMVEHSLFPAIKNETRRSEIFERLCSTEQIIPSLYTLLRNYNHLESASQILKKILPGKCRGSLSRHFHSLHSGQCTVKIQTSEFKYEVRTFASSSYTSWAVFRQLLALTLRHFPAMGGQAARKNIGKSNEGPPGMEYIWWAELTSLATESGYRRIRPIYQNRKAAQLSMIQDFIPKILIPKYYGVDGDAKQRKSRLIYEILFCDAELREPLVCPVELTSDNDDSRSHIEDRRGRPRVRALLDDEDRLFFDNIYSTSYDKTAKRYLTSFAVTRDFFLSFFGSEEDELGGSYGFHPREDSSHERVPDHDQQQAASPITEPEGFLPQITPIEESSHATQGISLLVQKDLELDALRQQLAEAESAKSSLSSQEQRLRSELAQIAADYECKLNTAVAASNDELIMRDEAINGYKRQLMDISSEQNNGQKLQELQTKFTDLEESLKTANLHGAEYKARSQELENAVTELQNHIQGTEQVKADEETRRLRSTVSKLQKEVGEANLKLTQMKMSTLEQESGDQLISLEAASKYLFRTRGNKKRRWLNVITPAEENMFRINHIDPTDTGSIHNALGHLSNISCLTTDTNKQLRLIAPVVVSSKAAEHGLDTVVIVPQQDQAEIMQKFRKWEQSNVSFTTTNSGKRVKVNGVP
jgi:hypothetical protein